jgi:hypothetical protein
MGYLGTPIDTNNTFQSLQGKRFNGDGSTTDFTLDVAPTSTFDIEVFVENVRQDPNSAYSLSGVTLTFAAAPGSGTNNIYVIHQAKAVGTISAGEGTVQASSFSNDVISGHDALAAEPADTDEFLVSDAGTIKRIDYSLIKGKGKIGQVVQTVLTDNNQTLNTTTFTDLTSLTVAITPTATSSKILITSAIQVALDDSSGSRAYLRLLRGTTVIQTLAGTTDNNVASQGENYVFNFLDSPSSESEQTYKIQGKSTNSNLDIRFVYNTNDSISTVTTLTAMEVLA